MQNVTIRLPEETIKEIDRIAVETDRGKSEVLQRALRFGLPLLQKEIDYIKKEVDKAFKGVNYD
jgi:predicted transcriptional regulator